MQETLRVCVVQMNSARDHEANIAFVQNAVNHAVAGQCDLLALPEVAGMMNRDGVAASENIVPDAEDPFINACVRMAKAGKIWIQTGSTPVAAAEGKFLNHANLIDNEGQIRASYDKIHLFDIFLEGKPPFKESDRYTPGEVATLVDTPWGPWGLSICYDLRFPHLYRDYAKAGATVQFVPAAFTLKTGEAHWEVLLRARAIENGNYFIAAAQVGIHEDGSRTWGHSLVVDPWGEVLLDMGGDDAGFAILDLDLSKVGGARQQIASLRHERNYSIIHS